VTATQKSIHSAVKERPILFSAPMVRALLDGRKTMTRRVLNKQPDPDGLSRLADQRVWHDTSARAYLCPYGQPGDLLWVRESWAARLDQDHLSPSQLPRGTVGYWADGPGKCCNTGCAGAAGRVRAAMHMPRWASRILLEITSVRVERLHEISNEDAFAEGINRPIDARYPVDEFRALWDSISAARGFGWDVNPWVWVVEFRIIK
jgi:hypothetical protein